MSSVEKVKGHMQAECFNKLYVGGAFVDPIDGYVQHRASAFAYYYRHILTIDALLIHLLLFVAVRSFLRSTQPRVSCCTSFRREAPRISKQQSPPRKLLGTPAPGLT